MTIRRFIAVAALSIALAAPLGGCQFFKNLETFTELGTASAQNPITEQRLQLIQKAAIVVFEGLNAWRDACEAGTINATCREQIRAVQVYSKQIPPYLAQLRKFVRNNDQVNAGVIWTQVTDLIGIVKGKAAEGGINIGGAT